LIKDSFSGFRLKGRLMDLFDPLTAVEIKPSLLIEQRSVLIEDALLEQEKGQEF